MNQKGFAPIFILAGILIIAGLVEAYYMNTWNGQKTSVSQNNEIKATVSPSPTEATLKIQAGNEMQTVNGFRSFTVRVPAGWQRTDKTDDTGKINSTTFSQNVYSLAFSYQPYGASLCIYSDDKLYGDGTRGNNPNEDPKFAKFKEIKTAGGDILRRGISNSQTQYPDDRVYENVCLKDKERDVFINHGYAFINYIYPQNPDSEKMKEMDEILRSLEPKE